MAKRIELNNRCGHKFWLEEIEEKKYALKTSETYNWPIYITGDHLNPKMIDWDGADPICVGGKYDNMTVKKIDLSGKETIIEFE